VIDRRAFSSSAAANQSANQSAWEAAGPNSTSARLSSGRSSVGTRSIEQNTDARAEDDVRITAAPEDQEVSWSLSGQLVTSTSAA
jgi:hypothetical protein